MAGTTEAEAQRIVVAIQAVTMPAAQAAARLARAIDAWHRETSEPIAKAHMRWQLVRVLRAELERRHA